MILREKDYVEKAENAIKELKKIKNPKNGKYVEMLTTSKIRNLLAMAADIYNDVINTTGDQLGEDVCGRIDYLKVRFIYEVGRDNENKVRNFVEKAEIIECIDEIQGSKKNYILFNRYMEALVAYHRFYEGKDK